MSNQLEMGSGPVWSTAPPLPLGSTFRRPNSGNFQSRTNCGATTFLNMFGGFSPDSPWSFAEILDTLWEGLGLVECFGTIWKRALGLSNLFFCPTMPRL